MARSTPPGCAELGDLCDLSTDTGYLLAPARVTGYGSAQSFSSTVTIDAGTESGVQPDMTVVNGDGLVGRVIEVTSHTATVLLIVDADSTVGGKVGSSFENGFVDGRGGLADGDPLDLRLLDNTVLPERGQEVVTWGSDGQRPLRRRHPHRRGVQGLSRTSAPGPTAPSSSRTSTSPRSATSAWSCRRARTLA